MKHLEKRMRKKKKRGEDFIYQLKAKIQWRVAIYRAILVTTLITVH